MTALHISGTTYNADPADFGDDINERLWEHGLRQKLADSFAGLKRSDFESDEALTEARTRAATKVLDSLRSGVWGRRGSSDPIEAECRRLARKWWARLGASGQSAALSKIKASKKGKVSDEDAVRELLARYSALSETIAAAKAASASVDLDRLLADA